jgi:hypothetical protein
MDYLKVLGVVLGLVGTIILAVRVTRLLDVLCMAVKMHDLNFQVKAARASGDRSIPNIQMHGASEHIDVAEKLGLKLLYLGFALQVAGGVCTAFSLLL